MSLPLNSDTFPEPQQLGAREKIAFGVLAASIIGIVLMAIVSIASDGADRSGTIKDVFNATLPLLGTWVGTVLAYYFSQANFESAARSTRASVVLTAQQKLDGTKAKDIWVPAEEIDLVRIDPGAASPPVSMLIDIFNGKGTRGSAKRSRVPLLDPTGVVTHVLHKATVYERIALGDITAASTIADLLAAKADSSTVGEYTAKSFVVVAEGDSLSVVKRAMDRSPEIQDAIVTRNGKTGEPMTGWITNVRIADFLRADGPPA